MNIEDSIKLLSDAIEKEVFITSKEERIVQNSSNPSPEWLMDFRRVLLKPNILNAVTEIFFNMIGKGSFQVGGIEVAAIPLISGMVMKSLQKEAPVNGFFIRKSRKKTGLLHMVEGAINEERIVLVDDIINTGSSFMRQIEVIESLGKKVDTILVILRFRDESYYTELEKRGIAVKSIFSLDDFSSALGIKNLIKKEKRQIPFLEKTEWYFKSEGAHFEEVKPKSAPSLSEGKLYFGTDSGNFWALDALTGKVLWSHKVLFGEAGRLILSSPCIHKDVVFFGAYDGNFYALDKHTGKLKWVAYDADWIGSSPCVADNLGLVYVGMEFGFWKKRGGVAAYDIKTGKRKWQSDSGDYTHGSPAYSKKYGLVICGSNDGIVYGLHAKTGKIIWTYNAGGEVKEKCVLSPSEKYVAFGSFNKQYVVLETKTGKLVSIFDTLEGNYSSPCWYGESVLIFSSLDKRLYAGNINKRELIWTYNTGSRIFASPVVYQDKVYVGNNSARLYILDVKTGKEIAFFQATERITNRVCIDEKENRLYVPTYANEIIAIGLHLDQVSQN